MDALLDRAETLCAGEANAKYLRNALFERIPVDSAQLHMWHRFADLPGFAGRKEDVLKRYEKNKRRLIKSYSTDVHHWINYGRTQFDAELTALRIEPPDEFKGRGANIRYMANTLEGISRGENVPDPDAAGGVARRLGEGKPEEHKLPFSAKIHDQAERRDFPLLRLETVPADEKYHWHHLGAVPLTGDCGLWSSVYIWVPMGWAANPPPNNELDVYISLKFTGPTYVPGSTKPDAVLMDRILVAQPAAPAGGPAANPAAKVVAP